MGTPSIWPSRRLYLRSVKKKDDLQKQIREDINKIHCIQNEYIEEVFL